MAMARMTDRIVTTHVGSLARPQDLVQMMWDLQDGKNVDPDALARRSQEAIVQAVARQRQIGIDVVNDGELSKPGFHNYIFDRLTGFGGEGVPGASADVEDFPEFAAQAAKDERWQRAVYPKCIGPVEHRDIRPVEKEIANLRGALGSDPTPDTAFMNAVTPGQLTMNFPNDYYSTHEEYLTAAAEAMKPEYQAIARAGLTLQLDSPDSALSAHFKSAGNDLPDFHTHLDMAVEALNYAVDGIPAEQMRFHVCWGNYVGPHHRDIELREILPTLLRIKPATLSFEAANPRHAHEWEVFKEIQLPDDKLIMPGVIDVKSHHIEHPRLVAERLERYAELVGKERVIAGTDCGFSTMVGWTNIDPEISWAKLESLVEGARIASERLW
jgi:5-methyltetrahydropteroyltriglutamate--homocysteine methyltransferase